MHVSLVLVSERSARNNDASQATPDVVYVEMHGGCQGCGMASVTLRQGIESRILESVPGIRQVVDATQHAAGTNPYYTSAESGRSALE